MTGLTPTPEQTAIIDAFTTGQSVRVAAGAGTGKTTVLRLAAETAPTRRGLYVAYNKAIATDAQQMFGRNVKVSTTHALAYREVGHRYRARLNGPRVPAQRVAQDLGIRGVIPLDGKPGMQPAGQARHVQEMVRRFTASSDDQISAAHLPPIPGLTDQEHAGIAAALLPYARRLWEDKTNPAGALPFTHDDYVKVWALTRPDWGAEFILYDEAQDATPVTSRMVKDQQDAGAQIVVVGDSAQSIYSWRGAIDSMDLFDTPHRRSLTQSWRFGQAVADEANKWLTLLDAELRLTGNPACPSHVTDAPAGAGVDAVLCRTNATAVAEVVDAQRAGRRVAVVGGGGDARRLAEAAETLQSGRPTWHPELALFPTWGAVQDYADEPGGQDLRPFVRLIDTLGAREVMAAIDGCVPETGADVVVSTAHKAKGREWERVLIADDFPEPDQDMDGLDGAEAMLAYVSVTRARKVLHRGGLAWVDGWAPKGSSWAAPLPAAPTGENPALAGDEETLRGESVSVTLTAEMSSVVADLAAALNVTVDEAVDMMLRTVADLSQKTRVL